jgi:hypothetical protein
LRDIISQWTARVARLGRPGRKTKKPYASTIDTEELTAAETAELVRCEAAIQRGVKTYVEVGNALDTIRKGRSYRESHKTFEAYCQERWKINRKRASQLIIAAGIAEKLSNSVGQIPANERQARELAKATPAARLRVWEEATAGDDDDEPTAAELRDIISRLPPEGQRQRVADTRNYRFPFPHDRR